MRIWLLAEAANEPTWQPGPESNALGVIPHRGIAAALVEAIHVQI